MSKPKVIDFMYKGLILAYCPTCQRVVVFSSKDESEGFVCKACNTSVHFDSGKARGVLAYCECGNRIKAVTNCREKTFEFSCKCGYPISVEYNRSKERYFEMR